MVRKLATGLNGAGKPSQIKIIADRENYQGDVVFSPGYSVIIYHKNLN